MTNQNSRLRAKQNVDKQSIKFQNTGYKDAQ